MVPLRPQRKQLILTLRERTDEAFDIETAARTGIEFIVVLRKEGQLPPPNALSAAGQPGMSKATWEARARHTAGRARRGIARLRGRLKRP